MPESFGLEPCLQRSAAGYVPALAMPPEKGGRVPRFSRDGVLFSVLACPLSALYGGSPLWDVLSAGEIKGGYCGGVPPLPIPNREVKPACADGTAMQCGRVGGRPPFHDKVPAGRDSGGDLFFCDLLNVFVVTISVSFAVCIY